jgi:hypothetical protein
MPSGGNKEMLNDIVEHFKGTDSGEAAPPGWEAARTRPRVLIESEDFAERWAIEAEFNAAGFDVVSCGGPSTLAHGTCTLVATGACPAVAGADVVFHRLSPFDPASAAVLESLRRAYPTTPIVVEVPQPSVPRFAELLDGCAIIAYPATPARMVAAMREAAGIS